MRVFGRWVMRAILYLFCAQFAFLAFIQNPGNPDDFEKARLAEMVNGTAYKPFVYRTLLPTTVRMVVAGLPGAVTGRMEKLARDFEPLTELFATTPAADERHPVIFLVAYLLEFACLVGFAIVVRCAVCHFYDAPAHVPDLVAAATLLGLPVFYRYVSYDYDFPQLFLFTLGLLLLARRHWPAFYPVLILGAFNKETTVLLVLLHLLGNSSAMPRRAWLAHAAVQLALVAVVRVLLQFVFFADNPGQPVEFWLSRNWELVSSPARWGFLFFHFTWVGRTSVIYPTNYNLLFLLLLGLILSDFSRKPEFLRRGLWILVPLTVLTFFMGHFDEMRDYYEAYPVIVLLMAGAFCSPRQPAQGSVT